MSTKKGAQLDLIIEQQEMVLEKLKAQAKSINDSSLIEENERLTAELKKINYENQQALEEINALKKELSQAKGALFNKASNEKLAVFSKVQKRIDSVYYTENQTTQNRLQKYEYECRKSINETLQYIEQYGSQEYDDIVTKLESLKAELNERHDEIEKLKAQRLNEVIEKNNEIGNMYKNEPVTKKEMEGSTLQKSLESFIGLNVLSKAGILLLLVGIIMLGRFAYTHISDVFKGGLIYALGAVLIGIGYYLHKKEKTVFSNALISGGVSVLYAAVATCYFAFSLYGIKVTFLLCIAVTVIAILLSNVIKSQVVCAFGAVGGYLPVVAAYMISFGKAESDITFLPVSSVYFCLLAVIILIMTYNKRWYVSQYIGYGLQLIAIGGVSACAWAVRGISGYDYAPGLAVGFSIASFVIYLLMPAFKILKGKQLTMWDDILLGLNTVSGAISIGITLNNLFGASANAGKAVGAVFLAISVIYAVLLKAAIRQPEEKSTVTTAILSISVLILSMLVVPLIFGWRYAPVAWAAEGGILAVLNAGKRNIAPEMAGFTCMIASALMFIYERYQYNIKGYSRLEIITLCIIVTVFVLYSVKGLLLGDKGFNKSFYIVLELCSAVAVFGYSFYIYRCISNGPSVTHFCIFTDFSAGILLALAMAIGLRFGVLKNKASLIFSDITGIITFFVALIGLDICNGYDKICNYYGAYSESKAMLAVNIALLVIVNIAVLLFLAFSVIHLLTEFSAEEWVFTAVISVSILSVVTAVLMAQFNLKFSNVLISAIYIISAVVLLVVGFKKRFTVVRSGGLVLILCAFAKLCFVDTRGIDSAWKIASYFAFGLILIGISYAYQRFSKRLENEAVQISKTDKN